LVPDNISEGRNRAQVDGLTIEGVGFDPKSRPETLSPINIFGDFDGTVGSGPTGGITIRDVVVRDDSARPYLRLIDPDGFRHLAFMNATVINPYGCAAMVQAGHPLREIQPAAIPPANLTLGVVCRKSTSDSARGLSPLVDTPAKTDDSSASAVAMRTLVFPRGYDQLNLKACFPRCSSSGRKERVVARNRQYVIHDGRDSNPRVECSRPGSVVPKDTNVCMGGNCGE
jgi:hypothetical protein